MSKRPHPAAFPPAIINILRGLVPPGMVLDPFAGTGRIGLLKERGEVFEMFGPPPRWRIVAVELEHEWITQAKSNGCDEALQGDSTHLPFLAQTMDAVVTSPPYGNRLADDYVPKNSTLESHKVRRSYRIDLGRPLSDGNAAAMAWGEAYQSTCQNVYKECYRVLRDGGTLIVNMKDFIRDGVRVHVTDWHHDCLVEVGFHPTQRLQIPLTGDQNTARCRKQGKQTVDFEEILIFKKPLDRGLNGQ